MKLIVDCNVDTELQVISEATSSGKKKLYIEGIFAQAESKNRNGRVYGKKIMEGAVGKYITEQVSQKRAVGELNHPEGPTINLDKVSHLITDLKIEGNDVIGKASILPTPCGRIVEGLLEGGVRLGVSTRGMGSLEQRQDAMYVGEDYFLNAIDIVQDPSAPKAFVNGILEGVDWIWNNGIIEPREVKRMENTIKKTPRKDIAEMQIKLYKDFLNEVSRRF